MQAAADNFDTKTSLTLVEHLATDQDQTVDEKCSNWMENCSISSSDQSDLTDYTNNSALECGYVFENNDVLVGNQIVNNQNGLNFQLVLTKEKQTNENIVIKNSKKIIVGDVIIINGVDSNQPQKPDAKFEDDKPLDFTVVIPRTNWLAQPPVAQREYIDGPAKYVIIGHTATEEGFTQAKNVLLIRLLQSFHIDSRNWNDIAYNFLIGSDGLAYEGRGWGVEGSHTRGYNKISMGISFIGCFIDHLPPRSALKRAQKLIAVGVQMGHIAENYQLLGHRQCSATESPGKTLFEEIKTWKNWNGSISMQNPAPEAD